VEVLVAMLAGGQPKKVDKVSWVASVGSVPVVQ